MDPFVGRGTELATLEARLREARAGRPRIVALQGPPGVGKTALIERFLTTPRPGPAPTVLRASGEEAESLLDFGVLDQLARSAGPAGDPLRAALASPGAEPIAAGTRLLEALGDVEAPGPVVLVVDDLQWADQPSLRALVFVLRRLLADPVLALLAVREDATAELPESVRRVTSAPSGDVLRLAGLDEGDLRELAAILGVPALSVPAARRLRSATHGNPLHVRAVLEEFSPNGWATGRAPLPPPRAFRLLVADRYASCGDDTRRLVDAAAVLGARSPLPVVADLGEVADPVPAVDEAVRRGLLVADTGRHPWTLAFPHPLVRSALHDALGPARRSALHLAAARLVDGEVAVLHHRVAAAPTRDAVLADDLRAFAERAAAAQEWRSATRHLVESGRLHPDPDEGRRRVLVALGWMVQTGDAAGAATFTDELRAMPAGPMRDALLGASAMARDDPAAAQDRYDSAWRRCTPGTDPEVAATIALQSAIHHFGRLDGAGTVVWCRRALALRGPHTAVGRTAQTYLAHGLGYSGRAAEAFAAIASAEGDADDPEVGWLQPRSARGILRMVEDDLAGAAADFAAVAERAYAHGVYNVAAFSFAYLARTEYLAGDWDAAVVHAERAEAVNVESDWAFTRPMALGIAALVPAARGEWDVAEEMLARPGGGGTGSGGTGGYERSVVAVAMARARLAEARGDAAAAVAALEPVRAFPVRDAADEPGFWAWQDLYAEGLVGLGRGPEADALLRPHEELAAARGRWSSVARLARARGRVEAAAGRPDQAAAAFERALDAARRVPLPFERAKVELAAGAQLRRAGQRRRAAELLTAALTAFDRLGAAPYAQRCRVELAGSGQAPAARDGYRTLLTSQELVVARLAAAGRTNKEIARELVVSVKTVEYHLRNTFQKLGVGRRRELAGSLAEPRS